MVSDTEQYTIDLAGTNLSKKRQENSFVSFGEDGIVSANHISQLIWQQDGDTFDMNVVGFEGVTDGKVYVYLERYAPPSRNAPTAIPLEAREARGPRR